MNCDWVQKQTTLYAFGELNDADRVEVEQHLERCAECAREVDAEKELRRLLDLRPRLDASPALLAECRMNLAEALEVEPAPKAVPAVSGAREWNVLEWLKAPFAGLSLQWQAGMAVALLSVGFATGAFVSSRGLSSGGASSPNQGANQAAITNIRGITPRPGGRLEIAYDTATQQVAIGNPDDPRIREILVFGAAHLPNSGIRLESIEALKDRGGDSQIRAALVAALRSDRNSGVRLTALDALSGYSGDQSVRGALMEVLLSDQNPGVRIKAIDLLTRQRDNRAIQTLQRLAESDPNNYVRMKSLRTLREWNAPEETY